MAGSSPGPARRTLTEERSPGAVRAAPGEGLRGIFKAVRWGRSRLTASRRGKPEVRGTPHPQAFPFSLSNPRCFSRKTPNEHVALGAGLPPPPRCCSAHTELPGAQREPGGQRRVRLSSAGPPGATERLCQRDCACPAALVQITARAVSHPTGCAVRVTGQKLLPRSVCANHTQQSREFQKKPAGCPESGADTKY